MLTEIYLGHPRAVGAEGGRMQGGGAGCWSGADCRLGMDLNLGCSGLGHVPRPTT
jgi:hypothetical protein